MKDLSKNVSTIRFEYKKNEIINVCVLLAMVQLRALQKKNGSNIPSFPDREVQNLGKKKISNSLMADSDNQNEY